MTPQSDTVVIFLALFAMIGTVATLIVNAYILTRVGKVAEKTKETHETAVETAKAVDGAMHELLEAKTGQAKAEGITEGQATERARNGGTT